MHVMKMCQAFRQENHDVTLVAIRPFQREKAVSEKDLWRHYGIQEPLPVLRIPRIRILKLYHHHLISACIARFGRFDLVYARNLGAAAITAGMGIPTIFEPHTPIENRRRDTRQFHKLLNASGFRHLVVITHALKSHFLKCYPNHLNENNVLVAPDGVDLERFADPLTPHQARKNLGLSAERFTVGYSGHLYPGRGIEIILSLAQRLSEAHFLVVGGNDTDIRLHEDHARGMGLRNVEFVGFVPNNDLPRYLFACDALLMPHQRKVACHGGGGDISRWTSPMKMFEYMAAGRLILCSNLPVLHEVLNENNAVFCQPDNISEWVGALERSMKDDEWRYRAADQARQDVEEYTWRRRVSKILGNGDRFAKQANGGRSVEWSRR